MAWKKGESGNPGGRPKAERKLQDIAREHSEDAIATLAAIMNDVEASSSARVSAASAILDRGFGRPPQFTTGDADEFRKAMELSDDELAIIAAGSGAGTPEPKGDPQVTH